MEHTELIQTRFDLELSLLQTQRRKTAANAALKQAKFDLREAQIAQTEYGGIFKSFRDKLTGKREAAETRLRHAVQKAETALATAQQELDDICQKLPQLEDALSQLPTWESLKSQDEPLWHQLEARYCIELLIPLLEITHQLLTERRAQFNGTYAGQLKSLQDLADIYSAPEAAGEGCKPYLQRLESALAFLDIPFSLGSFFSNPTAFLSEATKFTQMDRINTALGQTEKLQRLLFQLQKELSA